MNISVKFTVFFDGVFWVGVFERTFGEKYEVSKVVFGSEPKDYELYDFVLKNFYGLRFSNPLSIDETKDRKINPKRLQREIKKETEKIGVGTKAQAAIKLQYETDKTKRRKISKEENEKDKEIKFEFRQQKKKEKHKGH